MRTVFAGRSRFFAILFNIAVSRSRTLFRHSRFDFITNFKHFIRFAILTASPSGKVAEATADRHRPPHVDVYELQPFMKFNYYHSEIADRPKINHKFRSIVCIYNFFFFIIITKKRNGRKSFFLFVKMIKSVSSRRNFRKIKFYLKRYKAKPLPQLRSRSLE